MPHPPPVVIPAFRPVIPGEVLDARTEAAGLLAAARAEAAALREAARLEAEDAIDQAREEGLASGRREAARRVAETEVWARARLAELEAAAVEVALAVAERVWPGAALDRAAAARHAAEAILAGLDPLRVLRVRVCPEDRLAFAGLPTSLQVDASLQPGDCVVEASDGVRDARATVRAELALEALAEALRRGQP